MIDLRRSEERGRARWDWLDSRFTFSFDRYFDPRYLGFGPLRVLNEDRIAPSGGFPMHFHRDMEIVTYLLEGALEHRDSLGNGSVIRPGEVQRMTAGTGIEHSEFNPSPTETTHLLQIWIRPHTRGLAPSYEQRAIPAVEDGMRLIASPDGAEGSVSLNQDVRIYAARLRAGARRIETPAPGRLIWIQLVRGVLTVNGVELRPGDGAGIRQESRLAVGTPEEAEFLWFDLTG